MPCGITRRTRGKSESAITSDEIRRWKTERFNDPSMPSAHLHRNFKKHPEKHMHNNHPCGSRPWKQYRWNGTQPDRQPISQKILASSIKQPCGAKLSSYGGIQETWPLRHIDATSCCQACWLNDIPHLERAMMVISIVLQTRPHCCVYATHYIRQTKHSNL